MVKEKVAARRERRRLTKGSMLDLWYVINDIKADVFLLRTQVSTARYEKRVGRFLVDTMRRSPGEVKNIRNKHIIYACVIPGAKKRYIGQTSTGRRKRITTHLRHSTRKKKDQWFHCELGKFGPHYAVWLTVHAGGHDNVATMDRLRREAELIYLMDANMNVEGRRQTP